MEILGYVAMLVVGWLLGLLGGGGAILTVPVMVYLFKNPTILATTYSLFIVGFSSLFGAWRYHRGGLVDYRTAISFAVPSFVGTLAARRLLIPSLPPVMFETGSFRFTSDQFVLVAFAAVMLAASWSMIRKNSTTDSQSGTAPRNDLLLAFLGLIVGALAGFVGAGGGFLIIPALVSFAGMPMKSAVGTSLLIIAANSLIGFGGDVLASVAVEWSLLITALAIALVGTFLGSWTSKFVPAAKLKPAFGWFVLVMATGILVAELVAIN